MEDSSPPQNSTLTPLETVFSFPPHRRRPLRSRTYHALIGLLSHCHTSSRHVQIKDVDGGDIRLRPVSEENGSITSIKVNSQALICPLSDSNQLKDTLVKETSIREDKENNGGFDCIQEPAPVLDRINSVADGRAEVALENSISSVDDTLVVENHTGDCAIQVSNGQDDASTVLENPTIDHSLVVENQMGDCAIQVSNDQDNANTVLENPTIDHSLVVENQTGDCDIQASNEKDNANTVLDNQPVDLGTLDDLIVDNDFSIDDYSEVLDSCFNMDMVIQSSETADDSNGNVTVFEDNMLKEAEHALKLKEMELEKLIQSENVGEDIEEGEISGEDDASIDALYEDTVSLEKRSTEMVYDSNKEEFMCDVEDRGYRKNEMSDPSVINKVNSDCNSTKMDSRTTDGERTDCHSQTVFRDGHMETQRGSPIASCSEKQAPPGRKLQENAAENQMAASLEKDGDAKSKKMKNAPLTKEERAKKRKRDGLKRAERKRELGVKRLKLQPVSKPKKVLYCHHYMQGRCHEGEKCTFSHDTVPSTKSKPCGHFARNTCMKGDDCPYDHQLSKYPCKNYSANGFCGRGSDCLFSHEISANQSLSTTPTSAHDAIPEKGGPSSKVSKPNLNFTSPPHKSNSSKNAQLLAKRTFPKAPKGISLLSDVSKTILTAEKSNEMSSESAKPKGINFLSFARPTQFDSSSEMFSKLLSCNDETRKSMKGGTALALPLPSVDPRPSKLGEPIRMRFSDQSIDVVSPSISNSLKTSFLSKKAAQSALEFAAKFEPSIKVGSSYLQSGC